MVETAKPLLDKLGVKPGSKVAVVDLHDPTFMKLLRERTRDVVEGKPRTPCDIVFVELDRAQRSDLGGAPERRAQRPS